MQVKKLLYLCNSVSYNLRKRFLTPKNTQFPTFHIVFYDIRFFSKLFLSD
jgi:hypothetical protein